MKKKNTNIVEFIEGRFMGRVKRGKTDRGFSLIELIIAIAILVILTGLLAPNFMRYIEKSRESVCRKNMDELINIYRMEHISDEKYTITSVIRAYEKREPCPSGGTYWDFTEKMSGQPWIMCGVHDVDIMNLPPSVIAGRHVYDSMGTFAGEKSKDILKELNDHFKIDPPITWVSNDWLRQYLFETTYGNTWPQFQVGDKTKYIQPYINITNGVEKTTKEESVLLFASDTNTSKGNWFTNMIYNPEKNAWYTGPSFTIEKKNWNEIETLMNEKGWTELK